MCLQRMRICLNKSRQFPANPVKYKQNKGDAVMRDIDTIQAMQDYIRIHYKDRGFHADAVCFAAGYSRRQADRLFKKYLNKTLQEYINAVCLTEGANELLHTGKPILEVALDSHFETHEGFSRSFYKRFHIMPSVYRRQKAAIPLFVQYPVSHYFALLKYKEEPSMRNDFNLCMITARERGRRKLIYLPSHDAQDYFSYCEEVGCEWEGLLNSIPEKLDTAALLELPDSLVENGFSKIAAGIEVPLDYSKELPASYKAAELPECIMLYFQSEPYENEEDFCKAIESTYAAIGKYNPTLYGYQFAYEIAPSFNFGADAGTGARLAVPALRIS